MLGDLILWLKEDIKQFFCLHDYEIKQRKDYPPGRDYKVCKKCGRVK